MSTPPPPSSVHRIGRRDFLRLAGVTTAAVASGALAGCTSSKKDDAGGTPSGSAPTAPATAAGTTAAPSSAPPTGAATAPSEAIPDLDALGRLLGDRLIRPGDARYERARLVYSPRFDGTRPAAVARCASADDVAHCVGFARASGTPVAVRNGGHSYAGYSTTSGLVVDVADLAAIGPGSTTGTARVGAGARLMDVYSTLEARGVGVPGGSCPTVGITGSTLGGGVGVLARKYGLSCDRLTAVELVTADGSLVRADDRHDADLFWAHRGGGGGNFGVVTALEFATFDTAPLARFVVRWDWARAHDVVAAWQQWAPSAPDELWSSLHLDGAASSSDTPHVYVTGVFVGTSAQLQVRLDELQHEVAAAMTTSFVTSASFLQTMLVEGGCATIGLDACTPAWTLGAHGSLQRESMLARSDFVAEPLSASGIEVLLTAIEQRRSLGLPGGAVVFDAYGGAVNRIAPDDTAFVHRDALACAQYIAPLPASADARAEEAGKAWLDGLWTAMRPHVSGLAYQNYIDPALPDWQQAYYGANLERLIDVKTAVDPTGVFSFPQGIPARATPGARP